MLILNNTVSTKVILKTIHSTFCQPSTCTAQLNTKPAAALSTEAIRSPGSAPAQALAVLTPVSPAAPLATAESCPGCSRGAEKPRAQILHRGHKEVL